MASNLSKYTAWAITLAAVGGAILLGRRKGLPVSLITREDGTIMKNYFGDKEFTYSETAKKYGIDNTPDDLAWQHIHELRDNVLNPAREQLGHPVYITSGYRSKALNSFVGGASNSQHLTGEAADITTKNHARNRELFAILAQMGNFDQLIWEKGGEWIHVSFRPSGRGQMLSYNGSSYQNINNNWQNVV